MMNDELKRKRKPEYLNNLAQRADAPVCNSSFIIHRSSLFYCGFFPQLRVIGKAAVDAVTQIAFDVTDDVIANGCAVGLLFIKRAAHDRQRHAAKSVRMND